MARQIIEGEGNVTAGGMSAGNDITITMEKRAMQPIHVMRLQAVQIAILIILTIMAVVNQTRYTALHDELEDIRNLANRAMVLKLGGENGI